MDSRCAKERVDLGRLHENNTRNFLNAKFPKIYNLKESTQTEDRIEKTDCWQISKSGKELRSDGRTAIKARLNKNGNLERERQDILVSLFDPFYGVGHPDTKIGRDMKYDYFWYISVVFGQIRVCNGKVIHEICDKLYEELLSKKKDYKPGSKWTELVLTSDIFPGCQIWLHHDAKTKQPKLLAFICPRYLESIQTKDKWTIKTHKYTEEL